MTPAAQAASEGVSLELAKIESLVAGAHRLVTEGRLIDLTALDGKVRGLCEAVLQLPGPEARASIHKLQSLLGSLDGYSNDFAKFAGQIGLKVRHDPGGLGFADPLGLATDDNHQFGLVVHVARARRDHDRLARGNQTGGRFEEHLRSLELRGHFARLFDLDRGFAV